MPGEPMNRLAGVANATGIAAANRAHGARR
jgi:hypothetical protein